MLFRDKGQLIGCMLSEIPHPNLPVLFKNNGLDFMIIDTEHGGFDNADLSRLIMTARLSQLPALIRLPDNQRRDITRLADMGADGFLLPMTHTRKDIEPVIQYARYAPIGKRGISSTRAHTLYKSIELQKYMEESNNQIMVFAQIESRQGLNNINDIVKVVGINGVILGPNDLACDLACIGETEPISDAIEKVTAAANAAGLASGIITANDIWLDKGKECGMQIFCIGSELSMIKNACRETSRKYKGVK